MRFFDLHCDTLYEMYKQDKPLYDNDLDVSLKKAEIFENYIGCFAVWVDDSLENNGAGELFEHASELLEKEEKVNKCIKICKNSQDLIDLGKSKNKNGAILTVEGGAALEGKLEKVRYLHSRGVKVMTLTWNGSNKIGDGSKVENPRGLTDFGVKVVKEMEKHGIIVDVSHASERLFYDVAGAANRPFIATHSNSYVVCPHKRNLTDQQFNEIKSHGGIVGVNFCEEFLNNRKEADLCDVVGHIEHFLSLSGEKTVCIGSDFDGGTLVKGIKSIDLIENLYEHLLKLNYNESLLDDIFYNNAYKFFDKWL